MTSNRLLLIDYSNMFSRFFHVDYDPSVQYKEEAYDRPKLRASMIYAMSNLIAQFKPKKTVIALDAKPYWRTEKYEYYKENRKHAYNADVFHSLMESITSDLTAAMTNAAWLSVPGAEADDIIAVIANECENYDSIGACIIYGSDGDFTQLDSLPKTKRFNPHKKMFVEKLGDPTKELLIKIVAGDPGDNIPPVQKGIGAKKALKIINENKLDEWLDGNPEYRESFNRNTQLIDFSYIPADVKKRILSALNSAELTQYCNITSLKAYAEKAEMPEDAWSAIAAKLNGD